MGIRPDKVRRQSIAVKQLKIKKAAREFKGKEADRKSLQFKMSLDQQAYEAADENRVAREELNKKLSMNPNGLH